MDLAMLLSQIGHQIRMVREDLRSRRKITVSEGFQALLCQVGIEALRIEPRIGHLAAAWKEKALAGLYPAQQQAQPIAATAQSWPALLCRPAAVPQLP